MLDALCRTSRGALHRKKEGCYLGKVSSRLEKGNETCLGKKLSYPSETGGSFFFRGLSPGFFCIFCRFAAAAGGVEASVSEVPVPARLRDVPGLLVSAGPDLGAWPAGLTVAEGFG